jgi:CheY-like chemotaxis protein
MQQNDKQRNGYRDASVLLFEPLDDVRYTTRSALHQLGFETVIAVPDAERMNAVLEKKRPDLILCETEPGWSETCELVRRMRNHDLGRDPFVNIILTIWNASRDSVQDVLESGADDLLTRPISTEMIGERVHALVHARKPFVVTSSYIGPARRKSDGELTDPNVIEVPNALRARVVDGADDEKIEHTITDAIGAVNQRRVIADADDILRLGGTVLNMRSAAGMGAVWQEALRQLAMLAEDMARRIWETDYHHIGDICHALASVATSLQVGAGPALEKDLALLSDLVRALTLTFDPSSDTAKVAREISETTGKISRRGSELVRPR